MITYIQKAEMVVELCAILKKLDDGETKGMTDLLQREQEIRGRLIEEGIDPEKEIQEELASCGSVPAPKPIPKALANPTPPKKTKGVAGLPSVPKPPANDSDLSDDDVPWLDSASGSSTWTDSNSYSDFGPTMGKGNYKPAPKCAHTHPLLSIPDGDKVLTIQGGSCFSPQGTYDVEIGFDNGMKTPALLVPWGDVTYVRFPIQDQNVPADKAEFDKLIDWTIAQMRAGKKVHCGCIGGHGRTGIFLAVLVNRITGQKDASAWMRKNYCNKAIESKKQVDWLETEYGLERVEPRHAAVSKNTGHSTGKWDKNQSAKLNFGNSKPSNGYSGGTSSSGKPHIYNHLPKRSVFGDKLT